MTGSIPVEDYDRLADGDRSIMVLDEELIGEEVESSSARPSPAVMFLVFEQVSPPFVMIASTWVCFPDLDGGSLRVSLAW